MVKNGVKKKKCSSSYDVDSSRGARIPSEKRESPVSADQSATFPGTLFVPSRDYPRDYPLKCGKWTTSLKLDTLFQSRTIDFLLRAHSKRLTASFEEIIEGSISRHKLVFANETIHPSSVSIGFASDDSEPRMNLATAKVLLNGGAFHCVRGHDSESL
ncbi:hypothetical protein NPIL_418891 [Nephila pilipes]|uniref:Uncharacterized protein n=1 Tax=Nephila pilipes TaxID=299642 RepID=A0A8X6MGL1_NEPPI|nr:hypothetical protein NPIL_418891 [Nephila pilipes]